METLSRSVARIEVMERQLGTLDVKLEKYMSRLDTNLEKLGDTVTSQNEKVNKDLAELRVEVSQLKTARSGDTARLIAIGAVIVSITVMLNLFMVLWVLSKQ